MPNHSDYLNRTFGSQKKIVKEAQQLLKDVEFDSIAVRGVSGIVIGSILAFKFHKNLVVVRKPDEQCHADYTLECKRDVGKYIIVDDFINSGATVRAIDEEVKGRFPSAEKVGHFLYSKYNIDNREWESQYERTSS